MKRRNVIKQIGLGLSAGMILPAWMTSCSEDDAPEPKTGFEGTIGIVGAGAAGLYAADILKAKGFNVVIFEASDRLGGRVRSLKSTDKPSPSLIFNSPTELSSDFPIELGAGQVIGSDSAWAKVINELKLTTVDLTATAPDSYFLKGVFADAATAQMDADFVAAANFLENISSLGGANVSVQQAITSAGLSPDVYAILNAWIGNKSGTSNDLLGIKALAEGLGLVTRNATRMTLADNPMQDALLSRFSNVVADVVTNSVVKEIDYSEDKVIVSGETTGTGPFSVEVNKVIVTVPVSILKSGGITFTPGLPSAKTSALSAMDMDAALKVFLDFKTNFWGSASGFLYGGNDGPEYFNSGVGRSELSKTLEVTIMGPKAAELSALGKNVITVLLNELDSIFAGKASLHVRKDFSDNIIAVIQDWSLEPYLSGGISYVKPGGTNQARVDLSKAVNNKLFFAGEATDVNGESGTINGALLSGERAANEVISNI